MEGWWVISPYFARENKSEKCHQLLGLFIYHVCDEEKKYPTTVAKVRGIKMRVHTKLLDHQLRYYTVVERKPGSSILSPLFI